MIFSTCSGSPESLFEGDIILTDLPEGILTPYSAVKSRIVRRGLRRTMEYLWIDRIVPYEIPLNFGKYFFTKLYSDLMRFSILNIIQL